MYIYVYVYTYIHEYLFTYVQAVEHEGPGIYDEKYLDYLLAIVRKARTYGISCFIDPHQV